MCVLVVYHSLTGCTCPCAACVYSTSIFTCMCVCNLIVHGCSRVCVYAILSYMDFHVYVCMQSYRTWMFTCMCVNLIVHGCSRVCVYAISVLLSHSWDTCMLAQSVYIV
jgi:hypothetical protein